MRYLLVILGAAIYGTDVQANQQQGDTWSLTTAVNSRHDNNIFRLNDETSLPSGLYRSDDIGSGSARALGHPLVTATAICQRQYRAPGISPQQWHVPHRHSWRVGWQGGHGPLAATQPELWREPPAGRLRGCGARHQGHAGRAASGGGSWPTRRSGCWPSLSLAAGARCATAATSTSPSGRERLARDASGLRSRQGASLLLGWEHKQTDYLQQAGGGRDSDHPEPDRPLAGDGA